MQVLANFIERNFRHNRKRKVYLYSPRSLTGMGIWCNLKRRRPRKLSLVCSKMCVREREREQVDRGIINYTHLGGIRE